MLHPSFSAVESPIGADRFCSKIGPEEIIEPVYFENTFKDKKIGEITQENSIILILFNDRRR